MSVTKRNNTPGGSSASTHPDVKASECSSDDINIITILINHAANSGESLNNIIKLLNRETREAFSGNGSGVYLLSKDRKYLELQHLNLPDDLVKGIENIIGTKIPTPRIRFSDDSLHLNILKKGKPQIIDDLDTIIKLTAEHTDNKLLKKLTPRIIEFRKSFSVIYVPLISEGKLIGMMSIGRAIPYTTFDMKQFSTIAEQLTIIIRRKQAEEQIKKERDLAQKYLDTAGVMLIALDKNGTVTMANKKAAEILGFKESEIIGKDWFDSFLPEEDRKDVKQVFNKLVSGNIEPIEYYDNHVIARDGQKKFISWRNAILTDASDEIIGMLGSGEDITEKKQIDDALMLTQFSIDHASNAILWFDSYASIVYANNAACNKLGYSREEINTKSLSDLDISFPWEKWQKRWQMLKEDGFGTLESLYKTKSGCVFPAEVTTNYLKYNGYEYGFTVVHDITERKKAEETIKGKLQFVQVVSRISSLFVSVTDINKVMEDTLAEIGILTGASRAYLFLFNYNKDTLDNTHEWCAEGVSPEIDNLKNLSLSTYSWCMSKLTGEGIVNIPNVSNMPAAANAEKQIFKEQDIESILISPVHISGSLSGFIGFDDTRGRDEWSDEAMHILRISAEIIGNALERKRSDDALQLTQFSMDKASISIFWVNPDGKIVYANDAACLSLDYSTKELLSMSVSSIDPDFSDDDRAAFWQKLRKKKILVFESRQRTRDGSLFPVDVTSNYIVFGDTEYNIVFVRDITERKRMQEQLMVTDRLASIGELAAGVAHEMNNPLTGVIGFSQLLLEKDIPDDIKEDLAVINHEAQRTAEVVRNLLTFARKHAPIKQPVNINSIIANVLRLRAYEQKVSNIKAITHLSPDLPEVMADNFQLQQVFLNIVLNAEHFMTESHGKGDFTISTESIDGNIKISFTDDGPGIKKKDLSHIFDPFFTTKDVGKGTGLGLSICHGIITEHRGRLFVESDYGKGATFIIELPVTKR